MFGRSQQNPAFQHFFQFLAARFERGSIGVDTLTVWNFTVKGSVVLQDFVFCLAHGSANVIGWQFGLRRCSVKLYLLQSELSPRVIQALLDVLFFELQEALPALLIDMR